MTLSENKDQILDSEKQTEVISFFVTINDIVQITDLLFCQHITLSNVNLHLYKKVSLAALASPTPMTSAGITTTTTTTTTTSQLIYKLISN